MKRLLGIILIVLISASVAQAQPGMRGERMERIHAAKMAYITDRLSLSSEQSGNFIPLYNEYERDLRGIRQSFLKKYKGTKPDDADDIAARQFVDDDLDYQQQALDLKRKYNDRFLKVLSPQQLADLYKAEREFRQMLMKRLEQRRGDGRFR